MSGGALLRPDAARVSLRGADARDFLQRMATADLSGLADGDARPSFLLERSGRLVDRVLVVDRGDDVLLIGQEGRATADAEWIGRYVIADDVEVADRTPDTFLLTLLGDEADALLAAAGDVPGPGQAVVASVGGADVTVARDEDVGGPVFHVVGASAALDAVRGALGALRALDSAEWAARRLLAGLPRWGREMTERTIPLELGVGPELSLTKGCFLGQEVIARLHHQKRLKRRLVPLEVNAPDVPVDGELLAGDEAVGTLTGAARDPGGTIVGLGFVAPSFADPGTSLTLRHAGQSFPALVKETA